MGLDKTPIRIECFEVETEKKDPSPLNICGAEGTVFRLMISYSKEFDAPPPNSETAQSKWSESKTSALTAKSQD